VIAFTLIATTSTPQAAGQDDAARLIAQRGARISDVKPVAQFRDPEIIPVLYYEKGNSAQSCGLFIGSPGKQQPNFVEILSSEPGAGYPQCLNITSIVPFKLQNKSYISVEYVSRETRDENYRNFHYLYRDQKQGFVVDETLTRATPGIETTIAESLPTPAKQLDGIKAARLTYFTETFPQWQLEQRDFISDANSSFAAFEDKKNSQCHLAVETGGEPSIADNVEYARDETCIAVLASSRFVLANTTYYLEIFKTGSKKQLIGIMSASSDGLIKIEKSLSDEINRAGATKNMKTAKAALANILH